MYDCKCTIVETPTLVNSFHLQRISRSTQQDGSGWKLSLQDWSRLQDQCWCESIIWRMLLHTLWQSEVTYASCRARACMKIPALQAHRRHLFAPAGVRSSPRESSRVLLSRAPAGLPGAQIPSILEELMPAFSSQTQFAQSQATKKSGRPEVHLLLCLVVHPERHLLAESVCSCRWIAGYQGQACKKGCWRNININI